MITEQDEENNLDVLINPTVGQKKEGRLTGSQISPPASSQSMTVPVWIHATDYEFSDSLC